MTNKGIDPNALFFITKGGRLTDYALSCGHIEVWRIYGNRVVRPCNDASYNSARIYTEVVIWKEHGTYHVRAHQFNGEGRLWWEVYRTITKVREAARRIVKKVRSQDFDTL